MKSRTPIVGYSVAFHSETLPVPYGGLYNYSLAGNGVFVEARREELQAVVQISDCEVRGLRDLSAGLTFNLPRVPVSHLLSMLKLSRSACVRNGQPIEALFHLLWLDREQRWSLCWPEQEATGSSVRPLADSGGSSYQRALIEVHSHHQMQAFFSGQDDADEQGFRVYGVLGEIFTSPKISVRVGCYGYFLDVPADQIFELPGELTDRYGAESENKESDCG